MAALLGASRGDALDIVFDNPMIDKVWRSFFPRVVFDLEKWSWYVVLEAVTAWAFEVSAFCL